MQTSADWQPSASIEILKKRAALMQRIRHFFSSRGYLEVDTPSMGQYPVTDVYLENIEASFQKKTHYLQTSPEYHMKRLLAAGSGPIFQLAKVFRDDELGRWHNPEFTLLEWYRPGFDLLDLMEECDQFLADILDSPPLVKMTYSELFLQYCDLDPMQADIGALRAVLKRHDLDQVLDKNEQDRDQYLFLLMSHLIEPALKSAEAPVAVYNFPPSQAALARIENGFASRVEIYYRGVELANGFYELTEAEAQQARFDRDNLQRAEKGLAKKAIDPRLIEALRTGIPACSGIALGIDRLMALALNCTSIAEVMAFAYSQA